MAAEASCIENKQSKHYFLCLLMRLITWWKSIFQIINPRSYPEGINTQLGYNIEKGHHGKLALVTLRRNADLLLCFSGFLFTKTSFSSSRNKLSGPSSLLCSSCLSSAALMFIVRGGWAPSTSMRPLSSPQQPCKGHTQVTLTREIYKDAA